MEPLNECPRCGHAAHWISDGSEEPWLAHCTVRWMGQRCECGEPEEEYVSRCPACGDVIDYCQGHGEIGDPAGRAILDAHDDGDHSGCHPEGCDEANWQSWRNANIPGGE